MRRRYPELENPQLPKLQPPKLQSPNPDLVWYASYGSNMQAERFQCYLAGGMPPGGRRVHPGCRDRQPPRHSVSCFLPGGIYFATESSMWGGGSAFYDPALDGTTPARAYLVTSGQFADVTAQETHQAPGTDFDLAAVLHSRRVVVRPGRYGTLLHVGDLDGYPLLTFTASWRATEVTWTAPSAPYLRMLTQGLCQAHGWAIDRAAAYLASRPGARGHWSTAQIAAIVQPHVEPHSEPPGERATR